MKLGDTPAATTTTANGVTSTTTAANHYSGVGQSGAGSVTQFTAGGNSFIGSGTTKGLWTSDQWYQYGGKVAPVTWTKMR